MGELGAQRNQEEMVADLKESLQGWRQVILLFHAVLLWRNPWHIVTLLCGVSYIFLMIWYWDLSLISSLSVIAAALTAADYLGPIVIKAITDPSLWTVKEEKAYDDICRSLVNIKGKCSNTVHWIYDLKTNQPLVYYAGSVFTLIGIATLGQVMNNLLLTYFLVMFILLLPGLWHNDPIVSGSCLISQLLKKSSGKNRSDKKGKSKVN